MTFEYLNFVFTYLFGNLTSLFFGFALTFALCFIIYKLFF